MSASTQSHANEKKASHRKRAHQQHHNTKAHHTQHNDSYPTLLLKCHPRHRNQTESHHPTDSIKYTVASQATLLRK
jgi:hypothetical protein